MPRRREEESTDTAPAIGRDGIALLQDVPLFARLSRRALKRLADTAQRLEYTPGAMVVAEGAPTGESFFAILEGQASVRRDRREIARLGPGEFFGELALLDGRRRAASVVAETDLVALRLTRQAFRDLVASDPDLPFQVMEILAQRIRDLEARLDAAEGHAPRLHADD